MADLTKEEVTALGHAVGLEIQPHRVSWCLYPQYGIKCPLVLAWRNRASQDGCGGDMWLPSRFPNHHSQKSP